VEASLRGGEGPASTLLERDRALDLVESALASARAGHGSVVVVAGEPGLGKTALIAETCRRATGLTLMRTACSEAESSLPFGMLRRLLGDQALGTTDRISGETPRPPSDPIDTRLARYDAVVGYLRHRASTPLVLAVDDLHWSDPDSMELLFLVCRKLGDLGVAVVVTVRPWPPAALEHARLLSHEGFAVVERLEPLSLSAGAALIEERLGRRLDPAMVERANEACAGNPLLLGQVVASWQRGEDALSGTAIGLAERFLLPRFAGVGAEALRWARAASVLGTRFAPGPVAALAGQSADVGLVSLETLCAARLVRGAVDGKAEFVHPLLRQVLYEDMAPPVRTALHAHAFRALTEHGAGPAEAAPHAVAAQLKGDPDALAALRAAAGEAFASGAVLTAAEHLEGALRLAATPASDLLLQLGFARLWSGDVAAAEQAVRRHLATGLVDEERVTGLRLLGGVLLASARFADAKGAWQDASDLASRFDAGLAAEVLLDATFWGWLFEGPRLARRTTRRVIDMLAASGTESDRSALQPRAMTADAYLSLLGGDGSGLDAVARVARDQCVGPESIHNVGWSWDPLWAYANLAKVTERFDDNEWAYEAGARLAKENGSILSYHLLSITQADALTRRGKLSAAQSLLDGAAELAPLAPLLAPALTVGMAVMHYERDELDETAACVTRLEELTVRAGESVYLRLWLLLFECRDALRIAQPGAAVAAAERAADLAERSGVLEPCVVPWYASAIDAHLAAGDLERVTALADLLDERCVRLPCQVPRAVAAAARAAVAWRHGRLDEADARFAEALCHHERVPMPLAHAETLVAYGRYLRQTRRAKDARQALHRALDMVASTGARRLERLAAGELAAAGGRRTGRVRSVSELTAQERRVAAFAAEGMTNVEIASNLFLSSKTVEHHLSSIYLKLGIRSRRELMRSARGGNETPVGNQPST
jgi:DNA-binding CsgD family transcriptional regulator